MSRNAVLFLCGLVLLATVLPSVQAVTCDSFTSVDQCEKAMTSNGGCKWVKGTGCISDPSKILPAGMVGIANIEMPEFITQPSLEVRRNHTFTLPHN